VCCVLTCRFILCVVACVLSDSSSHSLSIYIILLLYLSWWLACWLDRVERVGFRLWGLDLEFRLLAGSIGYTQMTLNEEAGRALRSTGWPRPIGCLIFIRHFPRKSPVTNGSSRK